MKEVKGGSYASFIEGGGATGDLIRSIDWSKTSIGPTENWPQSLKTSVTTALNTRFPILIWWGDDLTLIYNDAYTPIFAGKHPNAMGKAGLSLFGWGEEEVKQVIEPMLRGVMKTGKPTWSEDQLLILERNGYTEEAYFTWSYSPIMVEDGGVGGVLTIVTETTDRVIAQRRMNILRDLGEKTLEAKTLKEAYKNVSDVLDAHPLDLPFFLFYSLEDGKAELTLAGRSSRYVDHLCCPEVLSIESQETKSWPAYKVFASAKEVVLTNLEQNIGKIPSISWPENVNTAFITRIIGAGQKLPYGILITGISPRLEFDNECKSFLRLLTDQIATAIANVRTIEEERKRAEALAEIDRAKTIFFSNISHEFRTPLTLMLSPLEEVIKSSAVLTEQDQEHLLTAHRNTLRLQKLVNTLLDFSRIEAGRFDVKLQKVDLVKFTIDLASSFRSAIEHAGIAYHVNVEPISLHVSIDIDMWEKIVLNLISNAFKYTERGKIGITMKLLDQTIEFEVRDTGVGISKDDQLKIFERFYRVNNVQGRSQEGTGIGLSMVKELVNLLDGELTVDSEPGKGSVFKVTLPIRESAESSIDLALHENGKEYFQQAFIKEATSWNTESTPLTHPSNLVKPKVLVADDNSDMRQYITRLLKEDFEVLLANNGDDALEIAKTSLPDLVLSDIMMPKLDGFGLLKKLKAGLSTKNIPIIFLSARAGEEARVEGIQAGADDYLVKPFSAKELIARVTNQILNASTRRKTEKEFFNLFLQAPAHINLFRGHEHVVEFFHPLAQQFIGRDITGMKVREALPELHGQGYFELLDEVYRTGKTISLPQSKAVLSKDNGLLQEFFFNITYLPFRGIDGVIQGVLQFAFDVTEQAQSVLKLKESEERFRVLANSIPLFVWIADTSGQVEFMSDQWTHYSGMSTEDGKTLFSSLMHEEDVENVRARWRESFRDKKPWKVEFRLKNVNSGEYRWFFGHTVPLNDDEGNVIKWIGSASDIQAQKELNFELERLVSERTSELVNVNDLLSVKNEELAKAQSFLQTVLDSSIDLVTSFDKNLNFTFVNKRLTAFSDQTPENLIGKNLLQVNPGFEKTDGYQHLMRALSGEEIHIEARRPHADNTLVFETFIIPLKLQGEITGVVTMQRDITAIVNLAENLKASNELLKRSNEDLQQFAHVTSHDLKEPVRKIKMYGNILATDFSQFLPEKGLDYLIKIEKAASRVSAMIDGVLQYSTIDESEQFLQKVDLIATVKSIIEDLELPIKEHGVNVNYVGLPIINGYPTLMYQLFYNLINNSIKFRRKGVAPEINISFSEVGENEIGVAAGSYFKIVLQDNGIGFDSYYGEKIFESFTRLHSKDKYEGTGLGLALCRKIVLRHKGYIKASGELNKGASFNIFLPMSLLA
jgi:PAS domain S-box-containing protein